MANQNQSKNTPRVPPSGAPVKSFIYYLQGLPEILAGASYTALITDPRFIPGEETPEGYQLVITAYPAGGSDLEVVLYQAYYDDPDTGAIELKIKNVDSGPVTAGSEFDVFFQIWGPYESQT